MEESNLVHSYGLLVGVVHNLTAYVIFIPLSVELQNRRYFVRPKIWVGATSKSRDFNTHLSQSPSTWMLARKAATAGRVMVLRLRIDVPEPQNRLSSAHPFAFAVTVFCPFSLPPFVLARREVTDSQTRSYHSTIEEAQNEAALSRIP